MNQKTATETAPPDHYELFRQRDFRLYILGRLAFFTGHWMFVTAVGWELYERTGSAFALGMVGLTQVLPTYLFTLPAGHAADTYNRRRVISLMALVVAAANLGLALVSARHAPVAFIYCCLFAGSCARTFLAAAAASFLPQLVERRLLSRAINWNASVFETAAIAGPVAAGLLLGRLHQAAPVYAINACAALTFSLLLSRIRHLHVGRAPEPFSAVTLLNGFRFVFSTRIILGTITLDMFAVLLGGATALLPIFAKDILHAGPRGLGFLQAAQPAGAILCALYLAHRPPMQKAGRALLWCVTAFGLATVAFGFSRWFWFSFLMLCVCGAVDNVSVVVRHTLVQLLTPDEKRGRVSAVNNLFIGTSNDLGGFESGMVAGLFGPVFSVVSGGIGTVLVVLGVAWHWPEIRRYGRLDGAPPPEKPRIAADDLKPA
jgi:MFS family permease